METLVAPFSTIKEGKVEAATLSGSLAYFYALIICQRIQKKYLQGSKKIRTFAAGINTSAHNHLIINLKCSTKPFSF